MLINNGDGLGYKDYPTILQALADNRILEVSREPDGQYRLTERCDDYFWLRLSAAQLSSLGYELIAMAETP